MSGRQQEKSPAEQRAEISKLAAREGCQIAKENWFSDEAITGNSTTDERPGLAALLAGAKAGKFTVVLAWHTNRISREDPMDAIGFYNRLRKAGVNLHTCSEGAIDLDDFTKQLLLFVNQKGSNDYLSELAAKSLRGRVATAKRGDWNGGLAPYAMDRGEFDPSGRLIRRLAPGDRASKGNRLRLLPSADTQQIEAVCYAFDRFDKAHISCWQLARELQTKGYPAPARSLKGWTRNHAQRILTQWVYAGISRWGAGAEGTYYETRGEDVIPCDKTKQKGKRRRKPAEHAITVNAAHEGIIPVNLFQRVYRKARPTETKKRHTANDYYPLSGLLFCAHCGRRMIANTAVVKNAKLEKLYTYQTYVCASYKNFGTLDEVNNPTCGHHSLRAERVLTWLLYKLQEFYEGPGRQALLETIRARLSEPERESAGDVARLQKRADELDRQVNRLVTAISTTDAPELAQQLATVKTEREAIQRELATAKNPRGRKAPQPEAEQIAQRLRKYRDLTQRDPALLREVLRRFVAKIECRWGRVTGRHNLYPLQEVRVELRDPAHAKTPQARGTDCPAEIATGLVSFHVGKHSEPADTTAALADLLVSIWEERKGPKRRGTNPVERQWNAFRTAHNNQ